MSLSLALLLAAGIAAAAQNSAPAADGVYTAAQAERGKSVVEAHCSSCHGPDLTGLEGPALVGASFMLNWESRNVEVLFRRIRETMPPEAETSISEDEKLDATAYLLQQNGFPAGTAELTRDPDALARIQLSRLPAGAILTLRTGTLVRVTGCLSQGPGNAWILTSATEPRAATSAATQKAADAMLGTQTVPLLNVFPNPSAHKGHTMEATGLLMRGPSGDGVNVISLEMRGPTCQK